MSGLGIGGAQLEAIGWALGGSWSRMAQRRICIKHLRDTCAAHVQLMLIRRVRSPHLYYYITAVNFAWLEVEV